MGAVLMVILLYFYLVSPYTRTALGRSLPGPSVAVAGFYSANGPAPSKNAVLSLAVGGRASFAGSAWGVSTALSVLIL
jgi:hypothetical protein